MDQIVRENSRQKRLVSNWLRKSKWSKFLLTDVIGIVDLLDSASLSNDVSIDVICESFSADCGTLDGEQLELGDETNMSDKTFNKNETQ